MNCFVTLFDKNYITRGYALYNSLMRQTRESFILYVLGMDNDVCKAFEGQDSVRIFTVDDVLDKYPILSGIRSERNHKEFCWSLSAFCIKYVLEVLEEQTCVYLDSDIYFYSDPQIILDKIGTCSVMITPHNYSPVYDQTETSGKFCVQFMCFKNNPQGVKILNWWSDRIVEKCSDDASDSSFGDQKYLDDWESRFGDDVCVCREIGCGVAPWNCQKFQLEFDNNGICVVDRVSKVKKPLVFYHFHDFRRINEDAWRIAGGYQIPDGFFRLLYMNYINEVKEAEINSIRFVFPSLNGNLVKVCRIIPAPVDQSLLKECSILEMEQGEKKIACRFENDISYVFYYNVLADGTIRFDRLQDKRIAENYLSDVVWTVYKYEHKLESDDIREWLPDLVRRAEKHERIRAELLCDEDYNAFDELLCTVDEFYLIPGLDSYIKKSEVYSLNYE